MKTTTKSLALTLLATFGFTGMANAATTSYFLDQSNSMPDGVNYAKVTLSDGADASNAEYVDVMVEILVDAYPGSAGASNFGMDKFYFNYNNALTVDVANIINVDPASWGVNATKNAGGGFGFFDFELKGAGNSRTIELSFSIANVVGDTIADYAIADAEGMFFGAHVGGFGRDGEMSTIIAGNTPVPVPAAVWLLGSALGGLGFMRRRKSS